MWGALLRIFERFFLWAKGGVRAQIFRFCFSSSFQHSGIDIQWFSLKTLPIRFLVVSGVGKNKRRVAGEQLAEMPHRVKKPKWGIFYPENRWKPLPQRFLLFFLISHDFPSLPLLGHGGGGRELLVAITLRHRFWTSEVLAELQVGVEI
jgi:hypothetical protein